MPRTSTRACVAALLLLALTPPLSADQLDLDVLFADGAGGRLPSGLSWHPEGGRFAYLWDAGDGEALWVRDLSEAEPKVALQTDAFDIGGFQWSPDGTDILLETDGAPRLLDPETGHLHLLTDAGEEEEATFSPDGRKIAFIRDYDLFVLDRETGEERALTTGGSKSQILNGITDWVYWEELWGRDSTGFWWSPDGAKIAYYQFDESPVRSYPMVNFLTTYPQVEWQRYPKAGEALPRVRVGVLDLETGETTWLSTASAGDHYLPRVYWHPDGSRALVTRLNRDQTDLDLLSCSATTGECGTLMTETWPTWINLHDDFRWLEDGGFLWSSEKSGYRALYLHGPDGTELSRLSPESLAVGSVQAFNAVESWVVYDAFSIGRLGASSRRLFRQNLADGKIIGLTPTSGTHSANVSDTTGNWVHIWGDADTPNALSVRDAEGSEIATLPSTPPQGFDPAGLPAWEFATVPGPGETELPVAMLKPAGFDADRKYPVIMYHYGCPGSQVVNDAWNGRTRGLWHKMMAERGYVVFMLDNIASNFFGKAGEDNAHRSFGPGNVRAQLAGVEYLSTLPWVDTERIGLWGWSGGGYNTLYALTHAPGVFKAGVAGAPVSDWKFYDAIWTERYMDTPQDNPDGYATASALTAANQLEDSLLIVHGTGDDNVHPQNTIAMSHELIAAGKPFEQAIHPRQKHGFRGEDSRHFFERMTEFFDRHLGQDDEDELEVGTTAPRGARP